MDAEAQTFWIAVIAGVIVMLAAALVTVNIWLFLPIFTPFIGGFASGLLAVRGPLGGAREGAVAGGGGGLIIFLDFLLGSGFLQSVTVPLAAMLTEGLLVLVVVPYAAILGLLGGVVGGQVIWRLTAGGLKGST